MPRRTLRFPKGAVVHDVTGKTIIPGLVDTHSHIGIFGRPAVGANADGNEMTGPVQPGLRAIDAINPDDPGINMALAGGVTTANIMPGSGNAIGGQTLYVKLRGTIVEAMRMLRGLVLGGIKFANGENPKGAYGKKGAAPGTRMKVAALQREELIKAQRLQAKVGRLQKGHGRRQEGDAARHATWRLEPLVEVLERKRTVHFHCHRADDIMTAVRLCEEFGFELVLQHCTEGYRVAEELAKREDLGVADAVDSPGGKPEVMGLLEENAAILTKAGVKVAINTDDFITESRFFLRTGAIAVRGGMSEDVALKALTLHGAEMLHLEDRCGSLEKGKDADFVVLSGAPFSVYTQVLETYIEGEKVFDRSQAPGLDLPGRRFRPGRIKLACRSNPRRSSRCRSRQRSRARRRTPRLSRTTPKSFAVLAGRIHTVSGGTIDGRRHPRRGRQDQAGRQRKPMSSCRRTCRC